MSANQILNSKPLPYDENGKLIRGGSIIRAPLEVDIDTSGFVAVTLGASLPCKAVIASTRDGSNFLVSDVLAGTTYYTVRGTLELPIAKAGGQILFYAKGTTDTYLEVLVLD